MIVPSSTRVAGIERDVLCGLETIETAWSTLDPLHSQLPQKRNYRARPSKPSYGAAGANPERVWYI